MSWCCLGCTLPLSGPGAPGELAAPPPGCLQALHTLGRPVGLGPPLQQAELAFVTCLGASSPQIMLQRPGTGRWRPLQQQLLAKGFAHDTFSVTLSQEALGLTSLAVNWTTAPSSSTPACR